MVIELAPEHAEELYNSGHGAYAMGMMNEAQEALYRELNLSEEEPSSEGNPGS